jgi:hypothetical protein
MSLLARPKYKNAKLEQKINENKDKSELWLNSLSLNDNDMELVAYYLFQANMVSYLAFMLEGIVFFLNFVQTLTTLYLHENQIGDKGAQYLGEKLQNNTVRKNIFTFTVFFYFIQKLTELYLHNNRIGDNGAQYLAQGLSYNTVREK